MNANEWSINERIARIIDMEDGGSRKMFSAKLGILPTQTSNYLRPGKPISSKMVDKILTQYELINSKWLLTGKGPMKKSKPDESKNELPVSGPAQRFMKTLKELGVSYREIERNIPELTYFKLKKISEGKSEPTNSMLDFLLKHYDNINPEYLKTGKGKTILKGNNRDGKITNSEIMSTVLKHSKLENFSQLATLLNVSAQTLYQINKGTSIISKKMANDINKLYSEFSINWLLSGNDVIFEKRMDDIQQNPKKSPIKGDLGGSKSPIEGDLGGLDYKKMYTELLNRYNKIVDINQRLMETFLNGR